MTILISHISLFESEEEKIFLVHLKSYLRLKTLLLGFPGGAVVKNLPANAGDLGSSPGPGRSHLLWSNYARVPQLLSPRS